MTVYDKRTDVIIAKTTGTKDHLDKFGSELHKKIGDNANFRVVIEDAPLLGYDFSDIQKAASKITVERVLIGVNLVVNAILVFKLLIK